MRYRCDDFLLDVEADRFERAGAPRSREPKALSSRGGGRLGVRRGDIRMVALAPAR